MKHTITYNHQSQFIEMFGNPFENNSEMVPLSSLCSINPSKPKGLDDSLFVSFIPMDRISEDGEYSEFETKQLRDVKKGFTYCVENDVLFAKITPCMENGKGAILKGLSNGIGFGSTEFHVLRPIHGITNSEWLYFLTKLRGFRLDAAKNMTGTGGQKRVPFSYLLNFKVMRPPLEAQKEFAAIVSQADKSKFDGFKSQFIELIRDCQTYLSISDLSLNFLKGITPTYVESSCVEVINQACVTWDGIDFSNVKYQNSESSFAKGILNSDDLLLTMTGRGTLGRCNIFFPENDDITYIADSHISILRVNKTLVLPIIIAKFISLSDTQDEIYRNYVTGSTNQLDIVFSKIKNFKIPVPPMALQEEFAAIVSQADKSKYYVQNKLNIICHILTNQIQLRRCS